MGLDMYLTDGEDRELMYWRKTNSIHRWFVERVQDGVDDCGKYSVTESQLELLLRAVEEVLADASRAPEVLPTQRGFFFGSVEYDDWYLRDLRETRGALERILSESDSSRVYYYRSSW